MLLRLALLVLALVTVGCVSLAPYSEIAQPISPAVSPASRFLDIDGYRVHIEEKGSGEPVLLVHGFGGSTFSWRHVADDLSRDYRVVSIDLFGFGLTERPRPKTAYTRYQQGELVIGVLDALGLERAHVVAHSYGGAISMALAARAPERFESLTLVCAAGPEYPELRRTYLASVRPLVSLYVRTTGLRKERVGNALRRSTADDSVVTDELIDAYWERVAVEGSPRAYWGLTTPLEDPQGAVSMEEITVPSLAIWGADDMLIPADFARREAAKMPRSHFVALDGVGHLPMEESPEELVGVMRQFLEGGLEAFEGPGR